MPEIEVKLPERKHFIWQKFPLEHKRLSATLAAITALVGAIPGILIITIFASYNDIVEETMVIDG